jgi:hypothetical protein
MKNTLALFLFLQLIFCPVLSAAEAAEEGDADYAPATEEENPSLEEVQSSYLGMSSSYYSQARISAYDWARPQETLAGVDVFNQGRLLGKTPFTLEKFLVSSADMKLSANKRGYREVKLDSVEIPAEGEIRFAMLKSNPASFYTTPSFIAGLCMLAGSLAVYSQNSADSNALGLSLLGGGAGLICVTQVIARFGHIPWLEKQVASANRQAVTGKQP